MDNLDLARPSLKRILNRLRIMSVIPWAGRSARLAPLLPRLKDAFQSVIQ